MTSLSTTELRRALLGAARNPVLHFVLAGALLFAGDRWWSARSGSDAPQETILFTSADVARLRREWTALHGAPPAPEDEGAMIQRAADEEILEREAMLLGMDRGDRLVRDRLLKLSDLLEVSGTELDDGAREEKARAVGLERDDRVIRRYLAHLMEIGLAGPAMPPRESDVRGRWQRASAGLISPARLRLSQVYLGGDIHGAALRADAEALLARLHAEAITPERASALGDPFAIGAHVGPLTSSELARSFGPTFVAALDDAPVRRWFGPVPSAYGLHLVWLEERLPGRELDFDAVRNRVAWDVVREQQSERLASALARLRQKYRVEVVGG